MPSVLPLLALIVLAALAAVALGLWVRARRARTGRPAEGLRFDGLYVCDSPPGSSSYLRFYADGTVLCVSSTGTPPEVSRWIRRENVEPKGLPHGRFTLAGQKVSFSTRSEAGVVDYAGTVRGGILALDTYSHINGHRDSVTYRFAGPAGA